MAVDGSGLEILSRAACLKLLATRLIGRVAFTLKALPAILPVTYELVDSEVVFAVGTGRDPLAMGEQVIGFEVDSLESVSEVDWTVMVVGVARLCDEGDPAWPAARDLNLRSWAGQRGRARVRLSTETVTGRCLIGEPLLNP